jgi:hypothetical protein
LEGDVIHSSTCFLGLNQHNYPDSGSNLLDLVFSKFFDLSVDHAEHGLVQPDHFHSPLIIDCTMPVRRFKQNFNIFYKRCSAGDYELLYNALSTYDWTWLYNETSLDAGVHRLNHAQAIDLAVPYGYVKKHKYPAWFSGKLKAYIKKKNYFYRRYKKHKAGRFYDRFSFYRKLVKTTIKTDRFRWLKSVDENLKSHPKQFWKYVSQFRKKNTDLIHLEISGTLINKPRDVGEAFATHFQSVYGSSCSGTFPFINQSTDVLPLAPISNSDVPNAIKRLRSTKSVGLDGISSFIIKGCSDIFVPVLKFIFNLSLFQNAFPNLWKQAVIIPVFKKGKTSSIENYRPIAILNNFSKVF